MNKKAATVITVIGIIVIIGLIYIQMQNNSALDKALASNTENIATDLADYDDDDKLWQEYSLDEKYEWSIQLRHALMYDLIVQRNMSSALFFDKYNMEFLDDYICDLDEKDEQKLDKLHEKISDAYEMYYNDFNVTLDQPGDDIQYIKKLKEIFK